MANGEFNHRLSDYIVVMRGLISKEKCQEIIDLYKGHQKWDWAQVVGTESSGEVNLKHRKVKKIWISEPKIKSQGVVFDEMDNKIFNIMSKAQSLYTETLLNKRNMKYGPVISEDEGYQILHYSEGYYFKEHCDNSTGLGRTLTCTLNLNEGYEGGLFRFLRGEFDVQLGAGDAVLFPSSFMFPHEVTEITKGERYSIVTWFR